MRKDFVESLLRSGIIEAKAGEKRSAQLYLERALNLSTDHTLQAEAWYWLSILSDDPAEKRARLESCLSHDLRHSRARRALALLDGKLKPEDIIDPDRLSSATQENSQTDADRFMCPHCGARMMFAPDGQTLVCDSCTSSQDLASETEPVEQDFLIAMATARGHRKPVFTHVFLCQGCGAEFILAPETISTSCAYCESPHVVSLEKARELIQPEGIIPHTMEVEEVLNVLVNWLDKNKTEPAKKLNPPRGIYLPTWTFDIGGGIEYSGYATEMDHDFGGTGPVNPVIQDFYPVSIDDLPVVASRKTAGHFARLLPSFDLRATRPYDSRYLANWPAEVYTVPMSESSLDARSQAYALVKRTLPGEIASLRNLKTSSAKLIIESFKLVLLPVWITELHLPDRIEPVLINGQNGIVEGPASTTHKGGFLDWLRDILEEG